MKVLSWFLRIILPILLVLITLSFALENLLVMGVKDVFLAERVSGYVDNYVNEEEKNNDQINEIVDKIQQSEYVNEITQKYIDVIVDKLLNNTNEKLDITEEVKKIIETEFSNDLTQEQKDKIYESVEDNSNVIEEKIEENIDTSFNNSNFLLFAKVYDIFTGFNFRLILSIIIAIDIIVLIILRKTEVLKDLAISTLITSILSAIIFVIIKLICFVIEQNYANVKIDDMNFRLLKYLIVIEFGISIILFVIRAIVKKIKKSKVNKKDVL